jgi:hypothetical protein
MSLFFDHPLTTHILLLAGDVLATIVVAWGILWESPSQPTWRHHIAMWLVIWGVATESVSSICLFAFDEYISQRQQEKIISLEAKIAPRNLTGADSSNIVAALKPLGGVPYDLGVTLMAEPDSWLTSQIIDALRRSGWKIQPVQGGELLDSMISIRALDPASRPSDLRATPLVRVAHIRDIIGVAVYVDPSEERRLGPQAEALSVALNAAGIECQLHIAPVENNMAADRIHVFIGSKP